MKKNNRIFRCLFEQSGTFKNEFKKLGYQAYDYDLLNDFGETDFQMDLFKEIENAYRERESIFDAFDENDTILAFFPCTRFEVQIIMAFKGNQYQQRNHTLEQKLDYCLQLHEELHQLHDLVTKLALVCVRRKLKLVIENPFSSQHYLTRYWCIEPTIIDEDRRECGDYYKKPTQYFFINCEPKNNFIFEGQDIKPKSKSIEDTHDKVQRSMISKDYANRFIREYIIDEKEN